MQRPGMSDWSNSPEIIDTPIRLKQKDKRIHAADDQQCGESRTVFTETPVVRIGTVAGEITKIRSIDTTGVVLTESRIISTEI